MIEKAIREKTLKDYEKMIREYYKNIGIGENDKIKIETIYNSIKETDKEKGYVVKCPGCNTLQYTEKKEKLIKCSNPNCDVEFLTKYQIEQEEQEDEDEQ